MGPFVVSAQGGLSKELSDAGDVSQVVGKVICSTYLPTDLDQLVHLHHY